MIYFIWFVLVVGILNLALLSFAFRDFSFLLVLQFLFSALLIPIATYQITRYYYPLPNLALVTEDKEKLEEEFNNLKSGFFDRCH